MAMHLRMVAVRQPSWLAAATALASLLKPQAPEPVCELWQRRQTSSTASTSSPSTDVPLRKPVASGHQTSWHQNFIGRQFSRRATMTYQEAEPVKFDDMLQQSTPLSSSLVQGQQLERPVSGASEVSSVSQVIFESCWRRFEEKYRLRNIHVPREVVWLNGAPGSGKGANTLHILQTRGLEQCISMSDLLKNHPDSRAIINRGDMIPDKVVGDLVLESLLINACKSPECGVLVDGFPRTALQVDFLKLLNDKLSDLHSVWANTQYEAQFPRPLFKVVMLYVAEETSITRQMARAELAKLHNSRVMDAGAGELVEQRATDISVDKCKKRYAIFKQHYAATLRLKQFFPFHLIDAMGTLAETQEAITMELRYQSSLDLGQGTYQAIRHLPVAKDLVQHARQQLVSRLDDHSGKYPNLFQKVIDIITAEIMPALRESGMAGQMEYVSDLRLFNDHPRTAQMLIDILTDRGFKASHSLEVAHVPVQLDLTTGMIKNRKDTKHRFRINWDSRSVREQQALELEPRLSADTSSRDVRISQSFMPPTPPPSPALVRNGSAARAARGGLGLLGFGSISGEGEEMQINGS